jgi:hypothetical protein
MRSRLLDPSCLDAGGADVDATHAAVDHGAYALDVGVEASGYPAPDPSFDRSPSKATDRVPEAGVLAADLADGAHHDTPVRVRDRLLTTLILNDPPTRRD